MEQLFVFAISVRLNQLAVVFSSVSYKYLKTVAEACDTYLYCPLLCRYQENWSSLYLFGIVVSWSLPCTLETWFLGTCHRTVTSGFSFAFCAPLAYLMLGPLGVVYPAVPWGSVLSPWRLLCNLFLAQKSGSRK